MTVSSGRIQEGLGKISSISTPSQLSQETTGLKPTSLSFSAIAVLALSVVAASALAQAPQGAPAQQPPPGGPPRSFPAPTNLKVLPSTSTGQQVHDVMELW